MPSRGLHEMIYDILDPSNQRVDTYSFLRYDDEAQFFTWMRPLCVELD